MNLLSDLIMRMSKKEGFSSFSGSLLKLMFMCLETMNVIIFFILWLIIKKTKFGINITWIKGRFDSRRAVSNSNIFVAT